MKEKPKVREELYNDRSNPFQCHAFVCDSRQTARRLTFALAAAFKVGREFYSLSIVLSVILFQIFSKSIISNQVNKSARFAIDLRSPEEMEEEIHNDLDSEA